MIERIDRGAVVYRDGNEIRTLKATVPEPARPARLQAESSTPRPMVVPGVRLARALGPTPGGIGTPDTRGIEDEGPE